MRNLERLWPARQEGFSREPVAAGMHSSEGIVEREAPICQYCEEGE